MDKLDLIYKAVTTTEAKVEDLREKLSTIELHTDRNTNNLEEHMRRTDASEKRIEIIESKFTVTWLVKFIAISVTSLTAIAGGTLKLIGYFQ